MKKLFVPYEIALKLKELGFNEECFGEYRQFDGDTPYLQLYQDIDSCSTDDADYCYTTECLAPLYQQVIDWFREKHDFNIEILRLKEDREKYWGCITTKELYPEYLDFSDGNDYYTTKEKTILKAIEIIKNK